MMRLEIDGAVQAGDGSHEHIRGLLRSLEPTGDAILRVTDGRDNLDVVHLADGFHVTGNDPNDRQSVFASNGALTAEAALEMVVAYLASGQTPALDNAPQAPAKRGNLSGSQSKTPMVVFFLCSVLTCSLGLALLSREPVGQVSTPTYVAGIASLILWALFAFTVLSRGLELTRKWLARKLDVRIELDVSVLNNTWRVLDKGRWGAKFIVGVVPLLIGLSLLLGPLVGGSLFFIVG